MGSLLSASDLLMSAAARGPSGKVMLLRGKRGARQVDFIYAAGEGIDHAGVDKAPTLQQR